MCTEAKQPDDCTLQQTLGYRCHLAMQAASRCTKLPLGTPDLRAVMESVVVPKAVATRLVGNLSKAATAFWVWGSEVE